MISSINQKGCSSCYRNLQDALYESKDGAEEMMTNKSVVCLFFIKLNSVLDIELYYNCARAYVYESV